MAIFISSLQVELELLCSKILSNEKEPTIGEAFASVW